MFEIWNRLARIYEKFGCDDQWEKTEQAEIIGYELCEMPLIPRSEFQIAPRMAVYWHPGDRHGRFRRHRFSSATGSLKC